MCFEIPSKEFKALYNVLSYKHMRNLSHRNDLPTVTLKNRL